MENYRIGKQVLTIEPDEYNDDSPRDWDNLGKMVCFHNRYELGDNLDYNKNDYESWQELEQGIRNNEDIAIILPLYLYDHSGISMKVGSFDGLLPQGHAHFDSGQVGFIYATKEGVKGEFGAGKQALKKAEKCLLNEVDVYDDYIRGNVWRFAIIKESKCKECGHISEEIIDSCGGFYGSNPLENGILEQLDKKWHKFFKQDK